jgi:hypothetical protein
MKKTLLVIALAFAAASMAQAGFINLNTPDGQIVGVAGPSGFVDLNTPRGHITEIYHGSIVINLPSGPLIIAVEE